MNWWITDETPNRSILTIRWAESGSPVIQAPLGRGFGRQMIEQSLAYELGATVRMEFPPTGLVCTLSLPKAEPVAVLGRKPDS